MSNGNELNQFLNAMPGWLIQLRQMKQRAQQVKSQQDIQREKLELDQQRTLSVIDEAKKSEFWKQLKHDLDVAKSIKYITELAKEDGKFRVTYDQKTGKEVSRVPITEEVFKKETYLTPPKTVPEREQVAEELKTDVSIKKYQEELEGLSPGAKLANEHARLQEILDLGGVTRKRKKEIEKRLKEISNSLADLELQEEQPPPVVEQPQAQLNPEQRFNELIKSGISEDEVYQTLINEGYGQ